MDLAIHRIKIKDQNILLLSDTHGKHCLIDTPKNIQNVIHCGDICNAGDMDEIFDFFDFFLNTHLIQKFVS